MNEGLVDHFLSKSDPDFFCELDRTVKSLRFQFFEEVTRLLSSTLMNHVSDNPTLCLQDICFQNFFEDLCRENDIVEYYLTDDKGSFLLSDFNGNLSLLAVKDGNSMGEVEKAVSSEGARVSPDLIKAVKARKKLLYLHDRESKWLMPMGWEQKGWFLPAKSLKGGGQEKYFYAYIKDLEGYPQYDFNLDHVFSLAAFLEREGLYGE